MSKNLSHLSFRKGMRENLFDKMGELAVSDGGTPTKEHLHQLAKEFLMGDTNTYGAITAYDFMKPENQGKEIYVCNGSACLCAGTQDKVSEEISKHFDADQIGHMTCLGRCHENSSFNYGGKNYSGDSINHLEKIISKKETSQNGKYNVTAAKEVLTEPFNDLETFRNLLENVLSRSPEDILQEIKDSEIRGRGGAGFPMGIKWEGCKNMVDEDKFIICNADEGDPGAFSDRYLLEERPLAVIFGMMVAGYCTHANWGVPFIRAEYPEAIEITENAIKDLYANGLLGENILNSGFTFNFKVIKAKGAYICGEETALINAIEGQRPEVRTRPPFPTQRGLFLKPTIVNNVETLASVPWIVKNGGKNYAAMGTEKSSGTKLISLDGLFNKPGIVEVEMGTPLEKVINEFGGGFRKEVKALHIGGPLGGIVPVEKIKDLSIDFETFAKEGFLLGHASIVCIPKDFPMIKYLEHLFDFAAFESCGKCFPCRLGTKRAHEMLEGAANEMKPINKTLFEDLLNTLQQGSLCAHGGGIPLPARNAMQYFKSELDLHFA
ncbi:MAG: NADH-ubiquinone oxidoreductase-F iron-sulfur binding region domain-containing protein [Flavobacteriaceae bacterium]|nr:NADH-ubiquinone oxidoreductase-F iron-sulfur binding region domain-containing protein [Flavobacteriaceae bacterium]